MKKKGFLGVGVLAAIAASSCCIPPFIAAIAGIGGAAGSLSWIEPFRPYLIGLSVIAIGYAWYNYIKLKKEDDCGCDIEKQKWYQTKGFLVAITLFASISIAFPYYSGVFFSNTKQDLVIMDKSNIQKIKVSIEGMTCVACQNHVNHAVNELTGILDVSTSYVEGNTIVEFDKTKTTTEEIKESINSTGYIVAKIKKQ